MLAQRAKIKINRVGVSLYSQTYRKKKVLIYISDIIARFLSSYNLYL